MEPYQAQDDPRWAERRRAMVEAQLGARGIRDPHVLAAMGTLPREEFVPEALQDAAYEDRALPVGPGQTISQPYIVAFMTEKLELSPGQSVLEVGGGTGYQAALLSMLGGRVLSVESDPGLVRAAQERLARLHIHGVRFECGDGSLGCPRAAPFERILVTAGAPDVPPALVEQLAEGGRLLIPVGPAAQQMLVCVCKSGRRTVEYPLLPCRFVKLCGDQGWR